MRPTDGLGGKRPRVVYVTASLPFGDDERFVVPEIEELERQGIDVIICPRGWFTSKVESDARHLLARTTRAAAALARDRRCGGAGGRPLSAPGGTRRVETARQPLAAHAAQEPRDGAEGALAGALCCAGTASSTCMRTGPARPRPWRSSPARSPGVPFSFTAHRWDIAENNLLPAEGALGRFAGRSPRRVPRNSRRSRNRRATRSPSSTWASPRGRARPGANGASRPPSSCPRASSRSRGTRTCSRRCSCWLQRGVEAQLELAGVGEERAAVEREIAERSLGDHVILRGFVPHDQLLDELRSGRYDMVVLPSIITAKDEQEGIPVALMEALAAGVPAVATRTGGHPRVARRRRRRARGGARSRCARRCHRARDHRSSPPRSYHRAGP